MVNSPAKLVVNRWFGPGAWVALAVFALGRLALEPLRDDPHFDRNGMDAFNAAETYTLRNHPQHVKVAFFGSSQSLWAVIADDVARETGLDPRQVRNLASEGGTPFDMWNLIRRNEEALKDLRLAVVEVNPFVLRRSMDGDRRVETDVYQHGQFAERMMLYHRADRIRQGAEWVLPVCSVRHSLESLLLNVVAPAPGMPMYPCPEQRTAPAAGWHSDQSAVLAGKERMNLTPDAAAKRFVGNWRLSKLQDHSMRSALAWFEAHRVRVIFHEMPLHPEVVESIKKDATLDEGHTAFIKYVDSLTPPPLARIYTPDPADCGLATEHMADRTHINEKGAHLYSRHMAARLLQFLPELEGLGDRSVQVEGEPSGH